MSCIDHGKFIISDNSGKIVFTMKWKRGFSVYVAQIRLPTFIYLSFTIVKQIFLIKQKKHC